MRGERGERGERERVRKEGNDGGSVHPWKSFGFQTSKEDGEAARKKSTAEEKFRT